ncbi:aminodeoxychorismate lyase [Corynebacterium yudongzhengii]|uniref:Aminodeoxychorismate lyase n=1 Tax=Corynebacterium yudongzhengii TaxID=2080740 RepID=A0A2U1T5M9_9CORY|nr:aminodeoxychorismate lyase [Corynebacterium yudongzhengii]AWB82587.1 aminodeoxychorismate lyase [Corynebacterium yudongzhengii]PWC01321.1 aminodeoxychorismate lyase [Corynebacterium yudongzhengii]
MTRIDPLIYIIEPFGGSVRWHNPNLPHVFFDDAAVTRGDGVVETLLLSGGRPANLARHAQRFARSAEQFGLGPIDTEHWERAALQLAEEWEDRHEGVEARCTWTLSRGRASAGVPTAWMVATPISETVRGQRDNGVTVMTTGRGYRIVEDEHVPEWLPQGAKSLNYATTMAAVRHARARGFDDVIFVEDDRVLEGATSTVIVVSRSGALRTPPAGRGVLVSTSQAALFAAAHAQGRKVKEKKLLIDDLLSADSVWLLSSTRRGARVRAIDGHELPAGQHDTEIRALIEEALTAG